MTESTYQQLRISTSLAEQIAFEYFNIKGIATPLAGEIDFNFKITNSEKSYVLKVSRSDTALEYLTFQDELLKHLEQKSPDFKYPKSYRNADNQGIIGYIDAKGSNRKVRLLDWIDGLLYSTVNPKSENLRFSLGQKCGQITNALLDFNHTLAHRTFDWNLADALWVEQYVGLFSDKELEIISFFIEKFKAIQPYYQNLRKSTIHNDANDNNIVVSHQLQNPTVEAIIDYGDSVYSQIINDLSVVLAYGIMDFEQPLAAAKAIISGYNQQFPLLDEELQVLYVTTAMRLVISVTKSAINKKKEPENAYLLISEKSAWQLLEQWKNISESYAYYTFRSACGMSPCSTYDAFAKYAQNTVWAIEDLIPESKNKAIIPLDLSIASTFIGNFSNYINSSALDYKISRKVKEENVLFVGGYGEARPIYTTDAFKIKTNESYEHRTIHIGVDFWISAHTAVHALEDGEVFSFHNNNHPKDYGPTLILKHQVNDLVFYTLYGHLTKESLADKFIGKTIKKGKKIAEIGLESENGAWSPHLHFQIILDMLGHKNDFIGVSSPSNWLIFSSICPDPNLIFKTQFLNSKKKNAPISSTKSIIESSIWAKA